MNSKYISGPAQIKEMILIVKMIKEHPGKYTNKDRSKRFKELPKGQENLSDWTIKAMKGFGLLKTTTMELREEELMPTDLSDEIYKKIKESPELDGFLEKFENELRENPQTKVLHDNNFNRLLENAGIIDAILDSSEKAPSFIIANNFFGDHSGKFNAKNFKNAFWEFINENDVKNDSKTATGADNRVPSFIKYMENMGFMVKYNGEYIWTPSEQTTEFEIIDNETPKEFVDETKTVTSTVRKGQSYFRNKLIARDGKCLICNVSHPSLLIASHVKKHSNSLPEEKYDIENGITLCALHDKLFEMRFISFEENGELLENEWVKNNKNDLNINYKKDTKVNFNNKYFDIHRNQFYEKLK